MSQKPPSGSSVGWSLGVKGPFSSASRCLPLRVSSKAWRCKGYGVNTMLECTLPRPPGLVTSCMQLREGGQTARCVCQEAGLQEICYPVIIISLDSQNSPFFQMLYVYQRLDVFS